MVAHRQRSQWWLLHPASLLAQLQAGALSVDEVLAGLGHFVRALDAGDNTEIRTVLKLGREAFRR